MGMNTGDVWNEIGNGITTREWERMTVRKPFLKSSTALLQAAGCCSVLTEHDRHDEERSADEHHHWCCDVPRRRADRPRSHVLRRYVAGLDGQCHDGQTADGVITWYTHGDGGTDSFLAQKGQHRVSGRHRLPSRRQ